MNVISFHYMKQYLSCKMWNYVATIAKNHVQLFIKRAFQKRNGHLIELTIILDTIETML